MQNVVVRWCNPRRALVSKPSNHRTGKSINDRRVRLSMGTKTKRSTNQILRCSPDGGSHHGLMLLMDNINVAVSEGLLKRLGCILCMVSAKDYTVLLTSTELYICRVNPISGNPTGMGTPTLLVYDSLSHCSYHINGSQQVGPQPCVHIYLVRAQHLLHPTISNLHLNCI